MILSDNDLRHAMGIPGVGLLNIPIVPRGLVVDPLYEPIQPASIDLRMGDEVLWPGQGLIDRAKGIRPESVREKIKGALFLNPNAFTRVATLERIVIPTGLLGLLVGKSSWARDGLQVEAAGFLDPGWDGHPTLELKNLGPSIIILRPGDLIAQLVVLLMTGEPSRLYGDPELGSHYQGSVGPEESRLQPRLKVVPGQSHPETFGQ